MRLRFLLLALLLLSLAEVACQHSRDSAGAGLAELQEKAVAAQNEGRYAEAEKYNRETLKLMETLPNFPQNERARQMSNLASVLNLLGRPNVGMEVLLQSEHLLNEYPSNDPGQYITLDHNFARSYALQNNWNAAEARYRSALEKLKAANAIETGYGAENDLGMAYVYWKTGRLEQADRSYERALAFFRKEVGSRHPAVQRMEAELAQVKSAMQQRK
jgi:tetratricopeptide (TPR) repeat protein